MLSFPLLVHLTLRTTSDCVQGELALLSQPLFASIKSTLFLHPSPHHLLRGGAIDF